MMQLTKEGVRSRGGSSPCKAPLASGTRQDHAGSMSRPGPMRIELMNNIQVVIGIKFVRRQDTVLVAGFEERNRDHQSTGELEGVVLSEDEVMRHFIGLHRERASSRSMAPRKN